jgi:hypothetical protein
LLTVTFQTVGRAKVFTKNADGFEMQLANQTWAPTPIVASSAENSTVTLALPPGANNVGVVGLRLHWKDNPCCPRYYSNDPEYQVSCFLTLPLPPFLLPLSLSLSLSL